ncbi:hypothetical protein Nepgr_015325 [Nepenthes gracilis]|uniref:Uncharacterized protein n=1 Tax=Nepenthes gracilis TaxID=150966 RepID=A0AAD3XR04_NEPGR|nr:hypothetical protein Nepgr_015325 [Nepenthes gracilis]
MLKRQYAELFMGVHQSTACTKSVFCAMEISSSQNGSILWFFKDKGFNDSSIQEMLRRCKRLEGMQKERATENWDFLRGIGIQERKLPSIVIKCPKILTFGVEERLEPMVQFLNTLATKPSDVAGAVIKFPYIFSHSVEEKLCPLLAFFEALGIPEKQLGKMILLNPRIISYSIELKLIKFIDFLAELDLTGGGVIGKILMKNPFIMGYSVDKRLQPTVEFLKSVGLTKLDLQRVAVNYPEVLCRDVKKTLEPNFSYLKSCGFDDRQIATLVTGYPPVLIKSIKNSLEPKIKFLVEVMGRRIEEVVDYPEFFRYGLKRTLEFRQKVLTKRNIECSLHEMLSSNQKKFSLKFGLIKELA